MKTSQPLYQSPRLVHNSVVGGEAFHGF